MTDEQTPEEELELDGEDQDSGHDGVQGQDEDLDEELAEQEEEEEQERDSEPRSSATLPQVRGQKPAAATPAPKTSVFHSEDELPYIDDRVSKIWVGAIVAIFALILAYGLLFGKAGALTPPTPSPEPTPSATPTASITAAPSASLTAAPSITAVPSITPAPSGTPVTCATPTPAPTGAQPSPGC